MLVLDVAERSGWQVLSISGELDVVTAPQVRNEVVRCITDGATDLVLDLSRVAFVDSFGLGVLVGALKRVKSNGGRLVLVITEPRVLGVFELTGLESAFDIVATVDEALTR